MTKMLKMIFIGILCDHASTYFTIRKTKDGNVGVYFNDGIDKVYVMMDYSCGEIKVLTSIEFENIFGPLEEKGDKTGRKEEPLLL